MEVANKIERVRVIVRVRPSLPFEADHTCRLLLVEKGRSAISLQRADNGPATASSTQFKFDAVFDSDSSQADLFRQARIGEMIDMVLKGYHATIFCYGQTGSGERERADLCAYSSGS